MTRHAIGLMLLLPMTRAEAGVPQSPPTLPPLAPPPSPSSPAIEEGRTLDIEVLYVLFAIAVVLSLVFLYLAIRGLQSHVLHLCHLHHICTPPARGQSLEHLHRLKLSWLRCLIFIDPLRPGHCQPKAVVEAHV